MMSQQLPDALVEIFKRGAVLDASGVEQPLDPNISKSEAAELFATVLRFKPRNSLEVGLAHGISALAIVDAIKQNGFGHHHIIDPFQRNNGYIGKLNTERNRYSAISSFYERFPEEVIPQVPNLQFAFVDASHLFDFTLMEFVLIGCRRDHRASRFMDAGNSGGYPVCAGESCIRDCFRNHIAP
jgi:hypothetical protein